jgi:hypothetical protein
MEEHGLGPCKSEVLWNILKPKSNKKILSGCLNQQVTNPVSGNVACMKK